MEWIMSHAVGMLYWIEKGYCPASRALLTRRNVISGIVEDATNIAGTAKHAQEIGGQAVVGCLNVAGMAFAFDVTLGVVDDDFHCRVLSRCDFLLGRETCGLCVCRVRPF
jgi:hypothetical protein